MTSSHGFKKLGFIGLGAMGKPMVSHLANKLPADSRIWVYDVVEKVVDELCAEFPERIIKGVNAKDVAQQVVSRLRSTCAALLTTDRIPS
jgi:3-hydroxyisobutyrate dehydrogenase